MVREVLAGIRRMPASLPLAKGWFRGGRRAEDVERDRRRAAWQAHVELSCRLPLAAPHEVNDYTDAYLYDEAEAVAQAVGAVLAAWPAPDALRGVAEEAQEALRPLETLRAEAAGDGEGTGDSQGVVAAFLIAAIPRLRGLNDQLRAYLGSDVIIPEGSWHNRPPRH